MPPEISVVVVSWNTADQLPLALDALPAAMGERSFEVIVVDNDSEDGSVAMLRGRKDITLLELDENTGFTRGANLGAQRSAGRYILFLNPDVVAPPGSVAQLIARLEQDDSAYGTTPWFMNLDGSPQYFWRRAPGPLIIAFCFTRPGRKIDRLLGRPVHRLRSYEYLPDPPGARYIHGVGAACLLLRRSAFDEAGGFDERYFNFFQDAHLERYFARQGRPLIGDGTVTVSHESGVTLRRLDPAEVEGQFFHALRQYLHDEPRWRRLLGELLIRAELALPGGDRSARGARRARALRPVHLPR